jgi:hypothetical protein
LTKWFNHVGFRRLCPASRVVLKPFLRAFF